MAKSFTKPNESNKKGTRLTSEERNEVPFSICFSYKLENHYTFEGMEKSHLKSLQSFLNTYVGKPIRLVDKQKLRKSDKHDIYAGLDVQHYEVAGPFRIHGVYKEHVFHVIRIDTNHNYHKS